MERVFRLGVALGTILIGMYPTSGFAQPAAVAPPTVVVSPSGAAAPMVVGPEGRPVPGRPGAPMAPGSATPAPAVGPDGKPVAGAPAPETPTAVVRPAKPSLPPDPRELQIRPDPNGKVRFRFHSQPWADVLEWLAAVSGMSLDWQELPGDYLNLITQREYTIPETRDLINRHLLARGYTLLQHGEVLSVCRIEKLNPGLVPRVEPDALAACQPHEYVKVSFPLDWLISEKAVEELKPMLSPNAKITALKNTNRLEVMDAAINLREVQTLLQREQSDEPQQRLVREFILKHTRAAEVIDQLKGLLGMESKPAAAGPPSREQMEAMQQQAMMMQQMQRQGGAPLPQSKKEDDVRLVSNVRRNSILAHAPPDKMEIIAQAVVAIDVEVEGSQTLLTNINRMQVYRLHGVDPEALVKTLLSIGQLDPGTRLDVDAKNRSIIAYATLADHLVIRQVVDRLDGSERKFEVVQLRRLDADYVAGTIEFMMVGPPKPKQQPRYFDFYSPFSRSREEPAETDQFRVDADVENNRLLLWANEQEIEEVTQLLAKLGEIPKAGGSRDTVRVLDRLDPAEVRTLLDKLRAAWPNLAPNPLQAPVLPPPATEQSTPPPAFNGLPPNKEARDQSPPSRQHHQPGTATAMVAWTDPVPDRRTNAPASPPPVTITVGPDGRLVIASPDTAALDLLEELLNQLTPPPRDYRIYKLKHADCFWVRKNLENFFSEEDPKAKNNNSRTYFYYDSYNTPDKNETPRGRLSKRKRLKLIDDLDTNSILVQGADAEQLRTIEDLLRIYDEPQQADASAARVSAVIAVRYSKAQTIASAVKDVYRDLLSSNDKALNSSNPEQKNRVPTGANTYIFNEGGESDPDRERTRVTFKGKLSIGVDELTNTLLVSTEGEHLMKNISEMVRNLDEAARPLSAVAVVPLAGNNNAARVRQLLQQMLADSAKASSPPPGNPPREGATPRGEGGPPAGEDQAPVNNGPSP